MAIIRKKAKLRCIEVPEDVVRFVASRIDTNIRELEGALVKIDALSQTGDGKVTLQLAHEALGHKLGRPITIPAILEVVARRFSMKISDLQSRKRFKAVTHPRHICMYLARDLTSLSLKQIGGYFGGRDHTTVLHASRAIGEEAEKDPQFRLLLSELASEARNVS
jgi:chromosomal replication initiator protein